MCDGQVHYRLTCSTKPTVRVWRIQGRDRRLLARVEGRKAVLVLRFIRETISLKPFMRYSNGLVIYSIDEESAIRVALLAMSPKGLRKETRVVQCLQAVQRMDRGELFFWYSLKLRIGFKAIVALRRAYL